ncbi:unnamed protein product [Polarella glacialis]|uniref:Uncharacterized protein n=1 Tax=Polarella glacialis TaxID=89957 RepID=A0A813JQG1_POLGL|nr:unnamed protein product [Polarella glacialis]
MSAQKVEICCQRFRECWRGLPFGAGLALIIFITGYILVEISVPPVTDALHGAGSLAQMDAKYAWQLWFSLSLVLMLLINLMGLTLSSVAASKTRHCFISDVPPEEENCVQYGCRGIAQPPMASIVQFLVVGSFLLALALSFVAAFLLFLVEAASIACTKTENMQEKVDAVLKTLRRLKLVPNFLVGFDLEQFCMVARDTCGSAQLLLVGSLLVVLSQAAMMTFLAADLNRIVIAGRGKVLTEAGGERNMQSPGAGGEDDAVAL